MDRVSRQPSDGDRLRGKKKSSPKPDKNQGQGEKGKKGEKEGGKMTKKGEVESVSAL